MSMATAERAIDLGFSDGSHCVEVGFFGGEPLLHKQLVFELVRYTEQRAREMPHAPSVRFTMNTNGTLIDQNVIDVFKSVRDVEFFVSLDGARQRHDAQRRQVSGAGSFDLVMAGLQRLRDAGIRFHIAAVFGAGSAAGLGAVVSTAAETGAKSVTLEPNLRDD